MPVGRFVLDVHGESRSTWAASDHVCTVLQIINHLLDCVKDYRAPGLYPARCSQGRWRQRRGARRAAVVAATARLPAWACRPHRPYAGTGQRPCRRRSTTLGGSSLEISAIVNLARHFVRLLRDKDPLCENVRLGKMGVAGFGLLGAVKGIFGRLGRAPNGRCQQTDRQPMNDATPTDGGRRTASAIALSGSSFYTAMRILPRAQREAMFEIYSFCRLVDDVADSTAPHIERRLGLAEWRRHIEQLFAGKTPDELHGLAKAVRDFSLRKEDFLAVIDGMDMDAAEDIRAPDLATLDLYCDRVASAVGRLSVRVFGMPREDGILLAHHLGRALQLTNILRDIDEDAGIGRLYLPREEPIARSGSSPPIRMAVLYERWSSGQVCDAAAGARARQSISRRPTRSWRAVRAAW